MEVYRVETGDGLEHLIRILNAEEDDFSCETVHRDGTHEFRVGQSLNKCLFEEFLSLGYITQVETST